MGHKVQFHDLYKEGFDPLLKPEELNGEFEPEGLLKVHCDELKAADGVVIVHPNWRDQAPAILKGWVDRVIRSGVAFEFSGEEGEEGHCLPLLKTKQVTVFNTSDCSWDNEMELGDPLDGFWKRIVFGGCGVQKVLRKNFYNVFLSTEEERKEWLELVTEMMKEGY
jgi:putative NADPH-quinone reductase